MLKQLFGRFNPIAAAVTVETYPEAEARIIWKSSGMVSFQISAIGLDILGKIIARDTTGAIDINIKYNDTMSAEAFAGKFANCQKFH